MSQQFRTVTTNAGRNAVREALTQGKTVKLSHMSVGDGGGNPVTPLSTMTKLVNERFRAQINDIVLDPATPDLFTAELFIPQAEGGWYIREVGLWMDDGTLFAVGNTPLTEKPDISSGAATDLLVRLIIRVLDAATVSIEIDPAQVLATREYVDRKLDAHNKDGGAHETLARKSVQIKAGTGLTGGGTLEADRTLTVKYGNTAGTACQGNDVRLADARTPKPHKATHQTGGSDAITPADIGAAANTIQIKPGTGLSGGGTLEADRTLTVKYGNTAGTACQGNDVRLADARTPKPHKATHQTGGSDAITPADIGAADKTIQIKPGTGLTGGGTLEADRTLTVSYGTAAGTACQGNDARLSNARTPTAHKATHKTGGTDALTPADIGAAAKTVQIKAGTGLSGGGTLENNIELSMKLDGKTTQADAGGVITVKDVSIGGKTSDLASARGQIGDYVSGGSFDFNSEILDTKNIFFGNSDSTNRPFAEGPFSLQAKSRGHTSYKWISYFLQSCGYTAIPRAAIKSSYTTDGGVTYATAGWSKLLDEKHVGDGITVNNGIISVPEYEGATATQAGTSGLVPPPLAADVGKTLGADGTWSFAKDVAIGGNQGDLASARGQIGNNIRINTASDLNAYTKAGNWLFSDAAAEINFPTAGKGGELNCYVSTSAIFQFFTEFNNNRRYIRYGTPNSKQWSDWVQFVSVAQIGDGIRTTKGIISVPEYDGATTSTAGTGGLVPPAAAGQQDMVLTGSGKWVVPPAETFRLSMIGVPRYWRSTTLPENHVWANGDLALFTDWPELKKVYDAGGFTGMLLAYNANAATIAANLGKWRPNAANPTGLYVPNLSEQFFRAWTLGAGREAGSWQADAIRNIIGQLVSIWSYQDALPGGTGALSWTTSGEGGFTANSKSTMQGITFDASRIVPTATENRPVNVAIPVILYLGLRA